jgi:hypothetical protein
VKKKYIVIAILIILALSIVAMFIIKQEGETVSLKAGEIRSVALSARSEWLATDFSVEKGSKILIKANGKWTHGPEGVSGDVPYYGPEGYNKLDDMALLPSANIGALIAKIGSEEPFFVGDHTVLICPKNGQLFLAMNERPGIVAHDNNEGQITVTVQVEDNKNLLP